MPRLKIYKASAGSGKTFMLVREYLRIVFADPQEYKHVLGVTFTNKATSEMKERIVRELVKLSRDEPSQHLEALSEQLKKPEEFIRKRAALILRMVLHDYARFSISTIDSFFQKLIKSFARDIGLSAGYSLDMDVTYVLEQSIEKMISELDEKSETTGWLTELALEKVKEGKNWNFRKELKDLGSEVFKEKFQVMEGELQPLLEDKSRLAEFYKKLKKEKGRFEGQLKSLSGKALELLQQKGLSVEDFPYGRSSFAAIFNKYSEGKYDPPGVRTHTAVNTIEKWYTQKTDDITKGSIEDVYHTGLNSLLVELLSYYEKHSTYYHTVQKTLELFYQFALVADLRNYIRQYRDENDTMLISDTSAFIARVIGEQDEAFIFEKVGTYFHHFLIDEFQDTSRLQWNNFKPLLSNSISQNYNSIVVGDVKQSIYRFRNGDWRLLLFEAGEDIPYHEEIFLAQNYRSASDIIKFNNTLFDRLPALFSEAYLASFADGIYGVERLVENAEYFTRAYEYQAQHIPDARKEKRGYIELKYYTADEENSWKDQSLKQAQLNIDDALDRGYSPSDIVLLVRDTNEAGQIYQYLTDAILSGNTKHQYEILTERSLLVSSSPAVRLILSAFRILVNAGDTISIAELRSSYYLYIASAEVDMHSVYYIGGGHDQTNDPVTTFFKEAEVLQKQNLYELSADIIRRFDLSANQGQVLFLQCFQDAILEYLKDHEASLPAFLEWWELRGKNLSIATPESENSIWVMTIHKAKGLEFPIVMLPFCDWNVDHRGIHTNILWTSLDKEPFTEMPVIPVKYGRSLEESFFAKAYADEKMASYLDNLNLLYVALTRPQNELYIGAENKNHKMMKTVGDYMYQGVHEVGKGEKDLFTNVVEYWDEESMQLKIGTKTNSENELKEEETFCFDDFKPGEATPQLAIKTDAFHLYYKKAAFEEKVHKGNLVHEFLFRLDHWEVSDELLDRFQAEGKLDEKEKKEISTYLEKVKEMPEVKNWFGKVHKTYKERKILDDKGETLIPDRVVLMEGETAVIDFKTGKKYSSHREQVERYRQVLTQMGLPNVKGYLLYTSTLEVERV